MSEQSKDTVILITNNGMGNAEPALGHKLIRTYLTLLLESGELPAVIAFYTEGVRLAVDDSPVLDLLAKIEAQGTRLVLCSTCLNYFNLADQVKVGIVGGMQDILEAQLRAKKVITI